MRILGIIISFFFLGLLICSTSNTFMKKVVDYRLSESSIIKSDKNRFGDLYGFSWLPEYKIILDTESTVKSLRIDVPRFIHLYAICDSYLWKFIKSKNDFVGVSSYDYSRWNDWNETTQIVIDTTKANVLLIETDERKLRDLMKEQVVSDKFEVKLGDKFEKTTQIINDKGYVESLFNEMIESNLEFNLFGYTHFTPIKELKALLNYKVFNRIDKEVEISTDKRFLYIKQTTDSSLLSSSFKKLTSTELLNIVRAMNNISDTYKKKGFDEVYFSFIPNPVTIIEPDRSGLNYIIDKIQQHPALEAKCINVYNRFRSSQSELYYKSDTHWNYNGFYSWLNEANSTLVSVCNDSTSFLFRKYSQ